MNKVVTINLNGNAYQIDESGYEMLRSYLDHAAKQLAGGPDVTEIMADLEQAIGEKCRHCMGPHKTVVNSKEVELIISEMGPVEISSENVKATETETPEQESAERPKRFYKIPENAMIGGVCTGIAAYLNVDVTIVRLVFLILGYFTHGFGIFVYLVLMFIVPYARTSEEKAAAHGLPFSAQDLVDRAVENYARFKGDKTMHRKWKREWKRQYGQWNRQWRQHSSEWKNNFQRSMQYAPPPAALVVQPVFGLIRAVLLVLFVTALISLMTTGFVFFWPWTFFGVPMWVSVIGIVLLYKVLSAPVAVAYGAPVRAYSSLGSFVETIVIIAVAWWAFHHITAVHDFVVQVPTLIKEWVQSFKNS